MPARVASFRLRFQHHQRRRNHLHPMAWACKRAKQAGAQWPAGRVFKPAQVVQLGARARTRPPSRSIRDKYSISALYLKSGFASRRACQQANSSAQSFLAHFRLGVPAGQPATVLCSYAPSALAHSLWPIRARARTITSIRTSYASSSR